jgi:hypothetical protein
MASTYSPLKIELITTGEQSATWGSTTNVNLGTAIEEAITGSADVTFASADITLTLTDTNGSQTARNLRLRLTGTTGGARELIVPAIEKQYIVQNDTANTVTIKNSTGTGVAIPASVTTIVYNNGVNVVSALTYSTALVTPLLAATDAAFVNALPVTSGGTGVTTATGTGSVVRAVSPALTTPDLGTPSALVGTNITGTATGFTAGNATNAVSATTQSAGTNNTTIATTAFTTTAIANALQVVYPVGCIYTTTVATNPNTVFGFGTWVAFGAGRVLIGNGGGFTAGGTGGSADAVVVSHSHTASSSVTDPGHVHELLAGGSSGTQNIGRSNNSLSSSVYSQSQVTGISVSTTVNSSGVSGTGANLQPYVVVYMWQRTA